MDDSKSIVDRPLGEDIVLQFRTTPITDKLSVPRPPLWTAGKGSMGYFDEHCAGVREKTNVWEEDLDRCFFALNYDLIDVERGVEEKELPLGFYCNEFLNLNPLDIQEFLFFQRQYGRVIGARLYMPFGTEQKELHRPEPDAQVFAGADKAVHLDQFKGIMASQRLYDSLPDEEMIDKYKELPKLSAVTFREAIAAVLDAQKAIRDVLRIQEKVSANPTPRELIRAVDSSKYISHFLSRIFPSITIVTKKDGIEIKPETQSCNLIEAVFAQLANGLLGNDSYRFCNNPECGRMFTPKEVGRRADTKYCSSACQERAKRLRYLSRHQASNQPAR